MMTDADAPQTQPQDSEDPSDDGSLGADVVAESRQRESGAGPAADVGGHDAAEPRREDVEAVAAAAARDASPGRHEVDDVVDARPAISDR